MTHSPADTDEIRTKNSDQRVWTPYEQTQLARHAILIESLPKDTQTPVEYITGHVDFAGLDFLVTTDTLIPRLETEELIELAWFELSKQTELTKTTYLLDVGTGCGAIAICLAIRAQQQGIHLHVVATDISAPALAVARNNAARLAPSANIEFIESDLLSAVPTTHQFAVLTANLPYIPHQRIAYLDSSVKDFEPHVALDGGPDGLELIRRMLAQAPKYLAPLATILLEVDYTQTYDAFREWNADWQIELKFDFQQKNRFALLKRKS